MARRLIAEVPDCRRSPREVAEEHLLTSGLGCHERFNVLPRGSGGYEVARYGSRLSLYGKALVAADAPHDEATPRCTPILSRSRTVELLCQRGLDPPSAPCYKEKGLQRELRSESVYFTYTGSGCPYTDVEWLATRPLTSRGLDEALPLVHFHRATGHALGERTGSQWPMDVMTTLSRRKNDRIVERVS
ncbi:hypothetical protein CC1G_15301 [Coprinopsis cinerea okayama7|uniref:Uncharacterized protein n=1 Tax=Coprinopsis cinerea (strain Okayama-7 / 130 / ATCC MYA-4618 / FGSC 9003) TaxID=240176 RepID=D6RPY0_COPC7|nr:hypothetical protein CC1G_15301 [Coprinopsis cinerea okayama7\|eukprot:XP_002910394.1 hypothetical protein CC1G_15301 [Coprinopsis cinerea okayama7\